MCHWPCLSQQRELGTIFHCLFISIHYVYIFSMPMFLFLYLNKNYEFHFQFITTGHTLVLPFHIFIPVALFLNYSLIHWNLDPIILNIFTHLHKSELHRSSFQNYQLIPLRKISLLIRTLFTDLILGKIYIQLAT